MIEDIGALVNEKGEEQPLNAGDFTLGTCIHGGSDNAEFCIGLVPQNTNQSTRLSGLKF